MKKNLFLRLCLMMAVAIFIYACRTDHLPENEISYNNSSKFQLTSKRISLSEAKHKSKLLPELEKAESKLKAFSKTNAQGKVVNYGNGVSIDADDVIYIENGSNYHTYTFHIKRDNILPDDPVENLVLSPMADGTYKEVLVSYHLTPSEKEILKNGGLVETKGKTIITELANGTYSPLAKGMTSCGWAETYTVMGCSDVHNGMSTHNAGNVDTWEGCTADRKPGLYMTMTYRCDFSGMTDDMGNPINPGGSSGSSGGGISGGTGNNNNDGSGNNTSPCPDGGTLTEPQGLNTDPGDGNCSGIPTQINLPDRNTPCEKIKAQRNDEAFKKRMDTLKENTGLTKETGYIQKWGGNYEYKDNASATGDANTLSLPNVASNTYIKAFMHTHIDDKPNSDKKGIKMFSPADVVYFMDLIQNAQTQGHSLSDVYATMLTSKSNYQVRFTGNKYQIKTFNDQDKEYHRDPFTKLMEDYLDKPKQLELRFLKYIQEKMLLYGITLYRMNTDGTTTEIKLNADKTDTVENTCP